jgi:16S rRNA (guanine527-N7)-methyltransferase
MSIYTTEDIRNFLRSIEWELTDQQDQQLREYYNLIQYWNKRINLVSRADIQNLTDLHFFPSVWFASQLRDIKGKRILDLGTGGGFPGIIINILIPENDYILLDSVKKKTLFLKEVQEQLDLRNTVVCSRVEEYAEGNNNNCDIVVSRAVAELNQLWQWSYPLLNKDGALITLKKQDYQEEVRKLQQDNFTIHVSEPAENWKRISPALENKIIIKMEKR